MIQVARTELTPNPDSLIFILTEWALEDVSLELKSVSEAEIYSSVLAELLQSPRVSSVFLRDNAITVTKTPNDEIDWRELIYEIRDFFEAQAVTELISSEQVKFLQAQAAEAKNQQDSQDSSITSQIRDILNEYIQPAVAMDGGQVELARYDEQEKIVYVFMVGSCHGCPSATITLKQGIKNILVRELGEDVIQDVVNIDADNINTCGF